MPLHNYEGTSQQLPESSLPLHCRHSLPSLAAATQTARALSSQGSYQTRPHHLRTADEVVVRYGERNACVTCTVSKSENSKPQVR